jgi:shikimate kinase
MQLLLLGYMGSGKSSVGTLLAETLQYEFIDLDRFISSSEGATIGEIFQKKGEIYFRRKEAAVLDQILSEKNKIVLSTGGGTPCYGTVMSDLKARDNVVTIYLKNSLQTLTHRLFPEKEERPLIAHLETRELLNDFIRKHLFERSFYYNQAHVKVDCDELSPKEIVEQLVLQLF